MPTTAAMAKHRRALAGSRTEEPKANAGRTVSAPPRVLVADAQGVLRAGYRFIAERALCTHLVAEAADSAEAYRLFCDQRPQLAVIGISLPKAGGLDLVGRIHAIEPKAALLLV